MINSEIESAFEFKIAMEKFNSIYHNYPTSNLIFPIPKEKYMTNDNQILMVKKNYSKLFLTEWTFWKNISDSDVSIITQDGKLIALPTSEQVAVNFGLSEGLFRNINECVHQIELELPERLQRMALKTERILKRLKKAKRAFQILAK